MQQPQPPPHLFRLMPPLERFESPDRIDGPNSFLPRDITIPYLYRADRATMDLTGRAFGESPTEARERGRAPVADAPPAQGEPLWYLFYWATDLRVMGQSVQRKTLKRLLCASLICVLLFSVYLAPLVSFPILLHRMAFQSPPPAMADPPIRCRSGTLVDSYDAISPVSLLPKLSPAMRMLSLAKNLDYSMRDPQIEALHLPFLVPNPAGDTDWPELGPGIIVTCGECSGENQH